MKEKTRFLAHQQISEKLKTLLEELHSENLLKNLHTEKFLQRAAYYFAELNYIHPFREGDTRSIVMMSLFVEHYGFYMDHEPLAVSAGYVRDSFVMACLGQYSEFEHLEEILLDAVCSGSPSL